MKKCVGIIGSGQITADCSPKTPCPAKLLFKYWLDKKTLCTETIRKADAWIFSDYQTHLNTIVVPLFLQLRKSIIQIHSDLLPSPHINFRENGKI